MAVQKHIRFAAIFVAATLGFSCDREHTDLGTVYSSTPAPKHPAQTNSVHGRKLDAAFVSETINDVMLELQVSELAVKKAAARETMELAISIMTDHSIAKAELQDLAAKNNIALTDGLSELNRKQLSVLAGYEGRSFDKAYRQFIVKNNKRVIKEFEGILQNGDSDEVKDWAWGELGTLKRHLVMAQRVEAGGTASPESESLIE